MILFILLTLFGQDTDYFNSEMEFVDMESEYMFASQPLIEDIDSWEYIIGPGDVFWFFVQGGFPRAYSGAGSSLIRITVTPDGYAIMPSVGVWNISGMTLHEAADVIERGFTSRYPGLRGVAGLAHLRTFRLPVTGQVASPGIVCTTGANRLVYVLNKAGGITPAGSWTAVQIIHSDGDTTEVNITEFFLHGIMHSNPYLNAGDRIHVPETEEFIWIEGAVRLSGSLSSSFGDGSNQEFWSGSVRGAIEYISGETVHELVLRIGGTKPWAFRDSCYIIRSVHNTGEIRISAPLDNPDIDPELLPNDIVVCPGIPPVVAVTGYVYSPGVYPHTAGMGAFYYISQAGGFVREACESRVKVVMLDGSEASTDDIPEIPPGSSIIVPRKVLVGWQDPLLIFTSIASIIIAWKSLD